MNALKIERAVLRGHSWGGNVALQYAVDHPDRVAGLVLIDGGFLQIGERQDWPYVCGDFFSHACGLAAEAGFQDCDVIPDNIREHATATFGWDRYGGVM